MIKLGLPLSIAGARGGPILTTLRSSVRDLGWNVMASERDAGRIEAVDTTFWFGFKDDVVIRVREMGAPGSTRIDVRSKSRVGVGDLGRNARRVRTLLDRLQATS